MSNLTSQLLWNNLWNTNGSGSGGGNLNPLRTVAVKNLLPNSSMNQTGCDSLAFRCHYQIAKDTSSILISHNGWNIAFGGQSNTGNTQTITQASFEYGPTGAVVPITFNGARSKTIASGAIDQQSDEVTAARFGVSVIPAGTTIYVKGIITVPTGGFIPQTAFIENSGSGTQTFMYDSTATFPSSVDSPGNFTFTGTAPTNKSQSFMVILLGRPVADKLSIIGIGDSITTYFNDGDFTPTSGGSYFQRALRNATNTAWSAGINCSRSGATTLDFIGSNTNWSNYIKYCNAASFYLGTNDFGTSGTGITLATYQARISALQVILTSSSIILPRQIACLIGPRAVSSSDNFTTEAGQTVLPGWNSTGTVQTANDWLVTLVSANGIRAAIDTPGKRGTDYWKWAVTASTNNLYTSDGLHPNSPGHEAQAVIMRPILLGMQ